MVSGRTVGSSPLFAIASLACLVLVIVAGCATTQETPQQSYVWQMGRICDAKSPFWRMERVEADGRYLVQGATNAPPGRNDYVACMQEQFTKTPYREWLSQRATALESAPVAPSSSGSVTSSTATTTQSPLATTSGGTGRISRIRARQAWAGASAVPSSPSPMAVRRGVVNRFDVTR